MLALAGPAQGPLYRERWAFLHLELLRGQVQAGCAGRDRDTLAHIAELLAAPDDGVPFLPAARALAALRGVPCDAAFQLRALAAAFVLPEVVDPAVDAQGPSADCRALNVSMFLPYSMPLPGKVAFALEAVDGSGAPVAAATIDADTGLEDLRMGRAHASLAGAGLPAGRYRLRVRTLLDGAGPRPGDVVLEHVFHVLRGYQQRADGARALAAAWRGKLAPVADAALQGFLGEVERAYAGEAFDGQSDAVAELERLERALANARAGKAPWAGMTGDVALGLPTGGDAVLSAVVRLPADDAARPLLVFAGGAPAYDTTVRRPGAPSCRTGRLVARRLGDFGLGGQCHVAWLQSPATGLRYAAALPQALAALRAMLPTDGRTVVVLEYEAAIAAAYAGDMLRRETKGAVLVGAGAFSAATLHPLGDLRLFGVPMSGHPSSQGLERTAQVAAGKYGPVDWQGRFELAAAAPRPWTSGAAAARDEIAAFVRDVLGLAAR